MDEKEVEGEVAASVSTEQKFISRLANSALGEGSCAVGFAAESIAIGK
jgi:hypothetical protein